MNPVEEFDVTDGPPATAAGGSGAAILVVDDEPQVLEAVSGMLHGLGYDGLFARTGSEAIEVVERNPGRLSLAILDMCLPDMLGDRLCARLKSISPGLKIIFASGYPLNETMRSKLDADRHAFIQKPYSKLQLSLILEEILSAG